MGKVAAVRLTIVVENKFKTVYFQQKRRERRPRRSAKKQFRRERRPRRSEKTTKKRR